MQGCFKQLYRKDKMSVSQAFVSLFDNQEDCDVIFRIGSTTIGAHKLLLKPRSTVLYNLAKNWTSKDNPLVINDISLDIFKAVLRYIYSDYITITDENVFKFLYAAKCFEMDHLEAHCAKHINACLCKVNVLSYVEHAIEFSAVALKTECQKVFSKETNKILANPAFLSLSQPGLLALLDVDEINVLEIELFLAVKKWMVQQCKNQGLEENGANMRRVIGDALYKIHFPTMTMQDFSNEVTTMEGLLSETEMLQTYRKIAVCNNCNNQNLECPFPTEYRVSAVPQENILANSFVMSLRLFRNPRGEYINVSQALDLAGGNCSNKSHVQMLLQFCSDLMNSSSSRLDFSKKLNVLPQRSMCYTYNQKPTEYQEKCNAWIKALQATKDMRTFMSKLCALREAINTHT